MGALVGTKGTGATPFRIIPWVGVYTRLPLRTRLLLFAKALGTQTERKGTHGSLFWIADLRPAEGPHLKRETIELDTWIILHVKQSTAVKLMSWKGSFSQINVIDLAPPRSIVYGENYCGFRTTVVIC